ncbi:unnamed protein product [Timema podura]|uniref:Secreted protein n=1 Tax=Timema podura TaxID=61482 RepID=A0ABN7NEC4_TIMPD|nr:unnamed protein product [Timema podura]
MHSTKAYYSFVDFSPLFVYCLLALRGLLVSVRGRGPFWLRAWMHHLLHCRNYATDSNLVSGSLVYCKSDALDHATTEQYIKPVNTKTPLGPSFLAYRSAHVRSACRSLSAVASGGYI